MIARVWTALATRRNAAAYREHFEAAVVPRLRMLDGYAGGSLLTLEEGDDTNIIVVTRWRSIEAIHAFAGDDVEAAVVAESARRLLLSWDPRVRHYTVTVEDSPDPDIRGE